MTARRTKRANCLTAPNQTKTFNNNVLNGLKSLYPVYCFMDAILKSFILFSTQSGLKFYLENQSKDHC